MRDQVRLYGGVQVAVQSSARNFRTVVAANGREMQRGAGYDRMGQPQNGRSDYDAGKQFGNILSDAGNVTLRTTLGRLGDWATYRVPDADQRNAALFDPYGGMTPEMRAEAMRLDRLEGGAISGIATGVTSIWLGADQRTQDLVYGLSSAGDGFLLTAGGMAGTHLPGFGNQLGLRIVDGRGAKSEASVVWNNGWRTADGKFASPLGAGRSGASAEASVWDAVEAKPGWRVDRGPIAVRDASGQLRYYDGVAYSPSGRVIGLEVKSGGAYRTATQRTFDRALNSSPSNVATGVGQSTGITVQRSTIIRVP